MVVLYSHVLWKKMSVGSWYAELLLCYYPYLVFPLFAILLSLHCDTFCNVFNYV